jgi:ribosomal protein L30/L7E
MFRPKLPTNDALFNKGIITINTEKRCVLCSNQDETIFHVFIQCQFSSTVWRKILAWLGLNSISSTSVQHHFLLFGDLIKSKVNKKHRHIIWLATTWCIWRRRNNLVFRDDRATIFSTVNQIIYMSWFWFSGRLRCNVDITFDYWCTNPLDCLQII